MTGPDTEKAREILYRPEGNSLHPNWWTETQKLIVQALRSVRQEENEACAKVADDKKYKAVFIIDGVECEACIDATGTPQISTQIAQAIRNRLKEKHEI